MASPMDIDAQRLTFPTSKRPRANSENSTGALQHEDYTIGWISALPLEMTAAEAMLDQIHQPLPQDIQDGNTYILGDINEHNVVIACLPKGQYGTNNAATVANDMNRSFPQIHHRLMVGIGGGAPKLADVRLGDVVVSTEVVQSDLGKMMANDKFQRTSHPVRPPHPLMTAVSKLQASHSRGQSRMSDILSRSISQLTRYARPNMLDRLFENHYDHGLPSEDCNFCDQSQLVIRPARHTTDPLIHYGRVASGNQVIKDARTRDKLCEELGVICIEMEAAGLMNSSPCLVVRGICDYSDSHKNKKWQEYAALVAAAYAKELVTMIPRQTSQPWKRKRTQKLPSPELIDPEVDRCLGAMFVTDASVDREGILDEKGDICEGTCEWILSTYQFKNWDKGPPQPLWISAPPGMGKTFMSIYLSKHFEAKGKRPETTTIFFFCDNKVETRRTAVNILRGLMHQLISHQPNLVNTIISQWKQQSNQLFQESSFGNLWKIFEEVVVKSDFKTVYCIIDGLDECESSSLCLLLRKFERLSRGHLGTSPKLKLICFSRRYPVNITEALLLFAKIELDTMAAGEDDIRRFISYQVQELAQKKKINGEMCSRLEETFQKKSERTFLWVSFMAQDLQKQRLLDFEQSLDMLPAGLDAVYERILHNVEFQKRGMIREILYWIIVAKRPFTIAELCEAVDMKPTHFLSREEVCIELIESCGHLLQIRQYEYGLTSFQLGVTFLHQSAKDYIMRFESKFSSQIPRLSYPQLHEHATIVLIRYIEKINCHKGVEQEDLQDMMKDFPLAVYAVRAWEHHFRELEDITQVMRQGASFFKKDSEARRLWQDLYRLHGGHDTSKPVPLLHLSAFLSLDKLTKWCLKRDVEHSVEAIWGAWDYTALLVACEMGHEHILSLLLDAGANDATTCLEMALVSNKKSMVHLLAKAESCKEFLIKEAINETSGMICRMAYSGNERAFRILIEDAGWSFNWQNGRAGYSALASAMKGGHFKFTRDIIREWNVLPEHHWDILERACSSHISEDDFEEIIRLLIEHYSLDINATDGEGHNALCIVFKGRRSYAFSSTRALLQFGCNPDQTDSLGRTSMHCLVFRALLTYFPDFSNIMELLVCRSQHGVNQVCLRGQTILHCLVEGLLTLPADRNMGGWYLNSVPQIAKRFLELGVDRHIQNNHGLTSLQMLQAGLDHYEEETILLTEEYQKCVNLVITVLGGYYPVTNDEHSL